MNTDEFRDTLAAELPDAEVAWTLTPCEMGGCGPEIIHLRITWPDGRYAYGHFHPENFGNDVSGDWVTGLARSIERWFEGPSLKGIKFSR